MALLAGLGLAGGLLGAVLSGWLVTDVLQTPEPLRREGHRAFLALSLSLPIVVGTAGLRGVLAAYQRFDLINLVRLPFGVFTYLSPLLVLPFSTSLVPVVLALVAGRLVMLAAYGLLCRRSLGVVSAFRIDRSLVRQLVAFGRWLTVSNVVGPLLGYLDRFLIGAVVTVALVAYYTTPWEVITKLWIVPSALLATLFPAFATTMSTDLPRTGRLFRIGVSATFLVLAPVVVVTMAFAAEGLRLWLGEDFAARSTIVLQLLAIGVLVNSVAQIASALVQGLGRPDLTAKLHLVELVLYLPLLVILVTQDGLRGAAIAWLIRVTADAAALFGVSSKLVPSCGAFVARLTAGVAATGGVAFVLAAALDPVPRAVAALGAAVLATGVAWRGLLSSDERAALMALTRPGQEASRRV
jgi:O-antigen/teichoic acid export membrane protein